MVLARFMSLKHLSGLGAERQAGERACFKSDCISVLSESCALAECWGARAGAVTFDLRSLNHWDVKVQSKGLSSCRLQSSQDLSLLAASQKPEPVLSLCHPPLISSVQGCHSPPF